MLTEQLKSCPFVDRVAFHENALRPLCDGAAAEGAFEVVVLSEAAQHDVDRALPVLGVGIGDVGEDATLGCLLDEVRIGRVDEGDDRARGLVHDLLDQVESVLGAFAETDEGYVRPFPRRHGSDVLHFDLARDHLVPESGDDGRDESQAILALVRDQNTQMISLAVTHLTPSVESSACSRGQFDSRARWC